MNAERMTAAGLHTGLLIGYCCASVVVFVVLTFVVRAAYGRHSADRAWWWGPGVPTRAAWIVMETPAALGFAVIYFAGERALDPAPLVLFALWQAHYFHRAFVYPLRRRVRPGDTTPLLVPALAVTTNLGIAYLNAAVLSWPSVGGYATSWLYDPRFVVGVAVFAAGYYVNRRADAMLAALRRPGDTGYQIPRGWLYERVSSPNYLGEILIWLGWALATFSAAGAVFLLWTMANLIPRAIANHRWYQDTFPDYPPRRRALIPGVL